MDEAMITQALGVLQQQFGNTLRGDMVKGEVALRRALMAALHLDESGADKLVKQLVHTGGLRFHSKAEPVVADGSVQTGAGAAGPSGVTEARQDTRVTTGNPQTDATLPAEPIIAAEAVTGLQTGNITTGATGGAFIGAAAAGVGGARATTDGHTTREGPDPDRDDNAVSSIAADRASSDAPGYWQIAAPGASPLPG